MNGANLFFPAQLGIPQNSTKNSWLLGVVNAAPYVRHLPSAYPFCSLLIYIILALLCLSRMLAYCSIE